VVGGGSGGCGAGCSVRLASVGAAEERTREMAPTTGCTSGSSKYSCQCRRLRGNLVGQQRHKASHRDFPGRVSDARCGPLHLNNRGSCRDTCLTALPRLFWEKIPHLHRGHGCYRCLPEATGCLHEHGCSDRGPALQTNQRWRTCNAGPRSVC